MTNLFKIWPLFKSNYSIGRGILTLEEPGKSAENEPDSLIDICIENNLKELILVDDHFGGALEAFHNCKKNNIKLIYGLRFTIVSNISDKSEESINKESKIIIFAKNSSGLKKLIKIYSTGYKDGFYYIPRIDYQTIKNYWAESDLKIAVPFYDSFIFKNSLTFGSCVPDFSFCRPEFFIENNGLPFDELLKNKVELYAKEGGYKVQPAQSIYYKYRKDFLAYLTFRCIDARTTLDKPNFDHMTSDDFSVESWKEKNAS